MEHQITSREGREKRGIPSEEGNALPVPSAPGQVTLWEWDLTTNQFYFHPEHRSQLGVGAEFEHGLTDWESRLHPQDRERVIGKAPRDSGILTIKTGETTASLSGVKLRLLVSF
jgi:hypothetical protein